MPENLSIWLNRLAADDTQAFRHVFEYFSPKIYLFALKLTRSRVLAEEVVQDVFIKVWANREAVCQIEHFPSYLYVVTRNRCFNTLKHLAVEQRVKHKIEAESKRSHSDTEETVFFEDMKGHLRSIVNELPPQQKMVYSLCHDEGLKYEEAAERLKISRLTVKTHMQHALRTIKSHLGALLQATIVLFYIS